MTDTRPAPTTTAEATYDRLLAGVGDRTPAGSHERVIAHWPHLGSAYDGVVILGQALHGWPDDFDPRSFTDPATRSDALRVIHQRTDGRSEPMDWLATSSVRNSPFWTVARLVTEGLTPGGTGPWFSRFAWANLYPLAPERGNPNGWLREAQDAHVGKLIEALMDSIDARVVVGLVGPYWWPAGNASHLAALEIRPRPLSRSGIVRGRAWIVGWHPAGASRRHVPPRAYASVIIAEARRLLA